MEKSIETRITILEEHLTIDQRIDKFLLRVIAVAAVLKFLGISTVEDIIRMFHIAMANGPNTVIATTLGGLAVVVSVHSVLNRGQL